MWKSAIFLFLLAQSASREGAVGGVFTAVIETTENIIGERRLRTLPDLRKTAVSNRSRSPGDTLGSASGTNTG
jgi:hypothetical protein